MERKKRIRDEAHRRYNGSTFFELKFIEGAEWADSHPHWISVDGELPEDNEWVLCYDNIDRCVSLLRYDGNRWWGDDGYGVDKRAITHWMPLPTPPKHFADVSNMISCSSELPNNHTKVIEKGGGQ